MSVQLQNTGRLTSRQRVLVPIELEECGENFECAVLELSKSFDQILLRANGNFEEQNKVFEPSITIINCGIIINS
jgi:hypothetical protein